MDTNDALKNLILPQSSTVGPLLAASSCPLVANLRHFCLGFTLQTLFTGIFFFNCLRLHFAIVATAPQKDQPKQIDDLVPKRGASSVA